MPDDDYDRSRPVAPPAKLWAEHGFALSPGFVAVLVLAIVLLGQMTAHVASAMP